MILVVFSMLLCQTISFILVNVREPITEQWKDSKYPKDSNSDWSIKKEDDFEEDFMHFSGISSSSK